MFINTVQLYLSCRPLCIWSGSLAGEDGARFEGYKAGAGHCETEKAVD